MAADSADFIVIGGGIAGVSAAYELSATGRVILLEMESAGLSRDRPVRRRTVGELRAASLEPSRHGLASLSREAAGGFLRRAADRAARRPVPGPG